jgi:uncharacterized membrane protein YgcG
VEIIVGVLVGAFFGGLIGLVNNIRYIMKKKKQPDNPEVIPPHKRVNPTARIYGSLAIMAVAVGAVSILFVLPLRSEPKDKEFSKAGMTITLTDDFLDKDMVAYAAYYESPTALVCVTKEDFSIFEQAGISTDISLAEYADLVMEANKHDTAFKEKDGLTCFEFDSAKSGHNYSYFVAVFRGSDAYWVVQFGCDAESYNALSEDFIKWAKSVKV